MIEIIGLAYAVALVVLGAIGISWWWILVAAVIGTVLYGLMRSHVILRDIQGGQAIAAIPIYYAAQVATAAVLFGAGRLVGMAF